MIKNSLKFVFPILAPLFLFNGCRDECFYYEEVTEYQEILMDATEVKNSFAVVADFTIKKPGNIYAYNEFLFVAEQNEGIHILNNTDPAAPVPLKFIKLKGNSNFAVANNILLADNGADLLSIDFSDIQNIVVVKRTENINPDILRADNKIVAGYNEVKVNKKLPCHNNDVFSSSARKKMSSSGSGSSVSTGKGGSMAKFAVVGKYLYIAHSSMLLPVEISNPSSPVKKLNISFSSNDVETIFPYKKSLYFGTGSGVLVYDCSGNPEAPTYQNTLTHALGCDPVVVDNDYCFSTVRNNTQCRNGNAVNALYVYQVTNIINPVFISQLSMESPYGLGVKGGLVFVCHAENGLSVYNWNASTGVLTLKHKYNDIHATDVIVNDNTLIVTAANGLFQFDCTDPDNIHYLSTLSTF